MAPEELVQVVLLVLQSAYSLSREDLVQSVARAYGIQRTGTRVRAAIERTLQLGEGAGMGAGREAHRCARRDPGQPQ